MQIFLHTHKNMQSVNLYRKPAIQNFYIKIHIRIRSDFMIALKLYIVQNNINFQQTKEIQLNIWNTYMLKFIVYLFWINSLPFTLDECACRWSRGRWYLTLFNTGDVIQRFTIRITIFSVTTRPTTQQGFLFKPQITKYLENLKIPYILKLFGSYWDIQFNLLVP